MQKELPKAYVPSDVEQKWYSYWEENHFFKADANSEKEPFCIVIPPPNVTGVLHMGHALVDTLQDVLIRYKRMMGFEALWVPGTDHAGISTQTVVEKHLIATLNKRRKDFSREEFLSHIWKWKEEKQERILNQLKKLGCSCDWSRLRFTMDEKSNKAVRVAFKKMFDKGLIYRGDYLVNWDPHTQTALADDEVEYEEVDSHIWYFKYPIINSHEHVIVATTRPETMLGDTAIAVNPKDPRFVSLVGKEVLLPLVNRKIPIITDDFVDPEFGSGMVKITPAHDHNDYQVALRHNLEMINIMTPDGHINENGRKFEKMTMKTARKAVVKEMEKLGFLEKVEPYKLRIGLSYRSKAIIEPYLSKQWFVKMSAFKEKLISAVKDKRVDLLPKHFEQTYYYWINNLRDWCISRQIWWGHRIPVWHHKDDIEKMICFDGEGLPEEVQKDPKNWIQDEDVLDTWFSSGLWPFSVLGWPEVTEELKKFYPTSVLVTAHDILFFWVARMIMMGEYFMEEVPFKRTFIHGLIYGKSYSKKEEDGSMTYLNYEEKLQYDLGKKLPKDVFSCWEKMSKSKGNVIDPLEIIDQYGTDAMRMALCSSVTHARQIDLDRRKFDEFKNFANKVWNGARFILQKIEDPILTNEDFSQGLNRSIFTLEDDWILSKVNKTIYLVHQYLEEYSFDKAAILSYEFFWDDFCSYYLEITKPYLFGKLGNDELRKNKQRLLIIVLMDMIRLLHPFAPFITEEIFSLVKQRFASSVINDKADSYTIKTIQALQKQACIVTNFPRLLDNKDINEKKEKEFEQIQKIVKAIRNIRAEMKIALSEKVDIFLIAKTKEDLLFIDKNKDLITSLVKIQNLNISLEEPKKLGFSASAITDLCKIFIPVPETLREKEKSRLCKEREKLQKLKDATSAKLNIPSLLEKAPKQVVDNMKNTLEQTKRTLSEIDEKLKSL